MSKLIRGLSRRQLLIIAAAGIVVLSGAGIYVWHATHPYTQDVVKTQPAPSSNPGQMAGTEANNPNPLYGKTFYRDDSREVTKLAAKQTELKVISDQPGTIWLIGPNGADTKAQRDLDSVRRTSAEAATQGTTPVYMLYAIPDRDACAPYSSGGFRSPGDYTAWIGSVLQNLQTKAVFVVEPDAVAHSVQAGCMTKEQADSRLSLIGQTITELKASSQVLAVYVDAGHSEWFPDSRKMAAPLKQAGADRADGIAVNISNFIATDVITPWAEQLATAVGGQKRLGVLLDTGRNGKGAAPASVTGDARWCNPAGRGIGKSPSTTVQTANIDAYFWGKNVGESDGNCFGNPPAGTFNTPKALELIRNRES